MSKVLWRPLTEYEGVQLGDVLTFTSALSEWREEFLKLVGVPKDFEGEWDFVQVGRFNVHSALMD